MFKHGKFGTAEYNSWAMMKRRCLKPQSPKYNIYGGRGITICEEWLKFENFYSDMGDKPTSKHSLDRIDTNGNYEPSNCRWATNKEQCNNKRGNQRLSFNGVTKTTKQWAEFLGMKYLTLYQRINKSKWPIEKALTLKIGEKYGN